jgi:large subunit ribosomal protein L21
MRAIIKVGSHQYSVEAGKTVLFEKLDGPVGGEVRFNNIVFLTDGKEVRTGPAVKGAVFGKIREQGRAPKLVVYKKIRRKGAHKKAGHRQPFTRVTITRIEV